MPVFKPYSIFVAVILILAGVTVACAAQASLSADELKYNFKTKSVSANGNVLIKRMGATLRGNSAFGDIENSEFTVVGNVKGNFPEQRVDLVSDRIKWTKSDKNDGTVEARGNVNLTRGEEDKLFADVVVWKANTEDYKAFGSVDGIFQNRIIKAGEIGKNSEKFWGENVIRYEDIKQKIGIAAKRIDGVTKNGEVQQVVASSDVQIDYIDKEGFKTTVTGNKAVYSKARGTIVVSGGAIAARSDGRTLSAESIVVYEDTKDVQAIGNSKITFNLPEKPDKNKKIDSKKTGGS